MEGSIRQSTHNLRKSPTAKLLKWLKSHSGLCKGRGQPVRHTLRLTALDNRPGIRIPTYLRKSAPDLKI